MYNLNKHCNSGWDGPVYSAATSPATVWSQFKLDLKRERQQTKEQTAAADFLPNESHATANVSLLARLQKLSTAPLKTEVYNTECTMFATDTKRLHLTLLKSCFKVFILHWTSFTVCLWELCFSPTLNLRHCGCQLHSVSLCYMNKELSVRPLHNTTPSETFCLLPWATQGADGLLCTCFSVLSPCL